ncbi:MAG: hypothetical protein PF487_04530 [Bacteroidales bacterium]|jgi:hypothetical protein|nr:hypothetical protein [Bacteroidales bacterium]
MRVYLDKKFVRNFWNLREDDKGILDHFTRTILHQTAHYELVTNYISFDEIRENEEDEMLFEMIFEGVPELHFENFNVDNEFIMHCTKEGGILLFLTEQNNEQETLWTKEYGYEFFSNNSLIQKWEKYFDNKEMKRSLSKAEKHSIEFDFNGWQDLSFIKKTPYKSLVIVDKYVLKSEALIKENLIPLIENILPECGIKELNILIIAENILNIKHNTQTDEPFKKAHDLITNLLSKYKNIKFNISIVLHNKSFYPKGAQDLHDRIIYTNYYTIEGPSGFEVYKNNERIINNNSKIGASSNFNAYNMHVIPSHLSAIKQYLKKIIRTESLNFKYYPENFSSSLIQF